MMSRLDLFFLLLVPSYWVTRGMISKSTNANKCMKVYYTHYIHPTCVTTHVAIVREVNYKACLSILCNAFPWRWPHEWMKHVGVIQCV